MRLCGEGAGVIDVGAESTRPGSRPVPAGVQIDRLRPVIQQLVAAGVSVSIDAWRAAVLRALLPLGVSFVNDVTAMRDAEARAVVRDHDCKLVIMHAVDQPSDGGQAGAPEVASGAIMPRLERFFSERIDALASAGIRRERLILDPGMGMFVGRDPAVSCTILRELRLLARFDLPLYVSTSRKSFIGQVLTSESNEQRPISARGAGTLATELWAALQGASYIRTHDVRALHDGLRMLTEICK